MRWPSPRSRPLSHLVYIAVLLLQQPAPAATPPETDEEAAAHRPGAMAPVPDWVVARPVVARTGVTIDAYDPKVESGRTWEDQAYDATVRNGAALAQSRQGPMDGGWTVLGEDGLPLFSLELADRGEGLEGVWRDLAAGPGVRRWGFVAPAAPDGGRMTLRLFGADASASMAMTLEPSADGSWRGRITRDGVTAPVRLRRK